MLGLISTIGTIMLFVIIGIKFMLLENELERVKENLKKVEEEVFFDRTRLLIYKTTIENIKK